MVAFCLYGRTMKYYVNIILDYFCRSSLTDKLYMLILYITIIMLGVDILSRFDGNPDTIYPALQPNWEFRNVYDEPGFTIIVGGVCSLSGISR